MAIGRVLSHEAEAVERATGVQIGGKKIALDASYTRHAFKSHGPSGEHRRGQRPIAETDLGRAREVFRASTFRRADERSDVGFVGHARIDGQTFGTVWEARKHAVILITMWKGA